MIDAQRILDIARYHIEHPAGMKEPAPLSELDEAPPAPVPAGQWPGWAKWLARARQAGDAGVGDTVARLLGKFGERFKALMKRLGVPCGCAERQAQWNARYPYEH